MTFKRATQRNLRVRILIDGVSGSGKTTGALGIATGLAGPDGRIGVIDTQNRQSRRYASHYKFGVADLWGDFSPEAYIAEIDAAMEQKIDVLVIDSASHEWEAILSAVDQNATGWKSATPRHRAFCEAIQQFKGHVIVTCKTKTAWEFRPNERGRVQPYRVGTDITQRGQFEYDFDLWLRLDLDHSASVEKSVIAGIEQGVTLPAITSDLGEQIREWSEGESAERPKEPATTPKSRMHGSENGAASSTTAMSRARSTDDEDAPFTPEDIAPARQNASQSAVEEAESLPDVEDDSEDTEPLEAPEIDANETDGSAQCDTCGTKIYPHVTETVGDSSFKGSTLIRVTRERFGRVLCVNHWLAEQRKATHRNPARQPAAR